MGRCQVDNCENEYLASGYCNKHYRQVRRHGKLMPEREYHYLKHTRIYRIWEAVRYRCNCVTGPKYHRYGGRGITISEEFNDPRKFYAWAVENGYAENLSIDRIDNDGNYCRENCQWISISENTRKDMYGNTRGCKKEVKLND